MAKKRKLCTALVVMFIVIGTIALISYSINPWSHSQWESDDFVSRFSNIRQSDSEIKSILFWSTYFGSNDFYLGLGTRPFNNCPYKCRTTDDKTEFNISSAILIHPRDIGPLQTYKLPKYRFSWQRFVMYLLESPPMAPEMSAYDNIFNWTMTYRLDSDIVNLYGCIKRKGVLDKKHAKRKASIWNYEDYDATSDQDIYKNKSRLIAWTVSNCETKSKRENYVRELMKFMPVEVFGACSGVKCRINEKDCFQMMPDYKFYLAFENNICKDYVTEKVFHTAFQHNAIPIVLGGADYKKLLPENSYIDIADFRSPEHLASYLKILFHDKHAYNSYFKWKEIYDNVLRDEKFREGIFCKLCEKLHNNSEPYKSYSRMNTWWNEETDCMSPEMKYPHLEKYFRKT